MHVLLMSGHHAHFSPDHAATRATTWNKRSYIWSTGALAELQAEEMRMACSSANGDSTQSGQAELYLEHRSTYQLYLQAEETSMACPSVNDDST